MNDALAGLVETWTTLPKGATVLVVTGAGVSLASGIPTFRGTDPDAVWTPDTLKFGTNAYFERDPVGAWRWYLGRFRSLARAEPNAAHTALAALERSYAAQGGELLLVTQNIDGLHRAAGSSNLVEIHGRADRLRCTRSGCELGAPRGSIAREEVDVSAFLERPSRATLPRCPACGALLRQHVLLFDELYTMHEDYGFDRAASAASSAALVIFAGTSFAVGITEIVLDAACGRAPVYSIDPTPRDAGRYVTEIAAAAEELLPALHAATMAAWRI